MELSDRILCRTIAQDVLPSLRLNSEQLVEMKCYQTIVKIYEILADDSLEDSDCFLRIESVVSELDALGIGAGGRHDF